MLIVELQCIASMIECFTIPEILQQNDGWKHSNQSAQCAKGVKYDKYLKNF